MRLVPPALFILGRVLPVEHQVGLDEVEDTPPELDLLQARCETADDRTPELRPRVYAPAAEFAEESDGPEVWPGRMFPIALTAPRAHELKGRPKLTSMAKAATWSMVL